MPERMNMYRLLEWDTRFFGYKIASIEPINIGLSELGAIIKDLRDNNFALAYCFINPKDSVSVDSITQVSGLLADEKITYSINLNPDQSIVSENVIPYDSESPTEQLKTLTLQSGVYSRFNIDPDFRNNEFNNLYLEWIDKSVSGKIADEVLVYKEGDEIQGFITLKIGNIAGSIGLIAVDEKHRGKSIGKKLLNSAFNYFRENGIRKVEVVTQKANLGACRFYEASGFEVYNIVNVYHLWIR
jgi:dTDP-4-amino-4,6-dideoxy-D-galactose acyltransferase